MPFVESAELAGSSASLTRLSTEPWPNCWQMASSGGRAYPVSREWLALLIRRMDAVAAVYRLAASLSPGTRSRRSHVEFHRRGRL